MILVGGCLIFKPLHARESGDLQTVAVLTDNFSSKSVPAQKNVLRQLGLLQLEASMPFLVEVALTTRFDMDIRRDALKAILAMDSQHYRHVILVLKQDPLDEKSLLDAMEQICHLEYHMDGWARSVDFTEMHWLLERKMNYIYAYIHKGETLPQDALADWDRTQAKNYLTHKIEHEKDNTPWKTLLSLLQASKS